MIIVNGTKMTQSVNTILIPIVTPTVTPIVTPKPVYPYQIPLSTDDYCNDWGKIHQDVPGCGRICSSEDKRGMKTADDDNFVLWSRDADISSECITASEIDKIWEVQSGSSSNRKLADGYTLSNYPHWYIC